MFKKFLAILLATLCCLTASACAGEKPNGDGGNGDSGNGGGSNQDTIYTAREISQFGSGTPSGFANYNEAKDTTTIAVIDAGLDNYGGVQTPSIKLDFSKAVIFQMEVVSCEYQYIVKLAVAGEKEYFYVLSDEGGTGFISINVVDAMLCDKYRNKNTQPNPGYSTGWKYNGQTKNCTFHILAKGPSGEQFTGEIEVKSIAIYNNQPAVTGVTLFNTENLMALKGNTPVQLGASIAPNTVTDKSVLWSSSDTSVATVSDNGLVNFVGVGRAKITATSKIDQSKSATAEVRVLSGYEDTNLLKSELNDLQANDTEKFNDLFRTEWNDMYSQYSVLERNALDVTLSNEKVYLENYFDNKNTSMVSQATSDNVSGKAYTKVQVVGASNGDTVYMLSDGKVTTTTYQDGIAVRYAQLNGSKFTKTSSYTDYFIIVKQDGSVKKFAVENRAVTSIVKYTANDFANSEKWIIPDSSKQKELDFENPEYIIHSLSPASVKVENNVAVIKQNKYAESAFCFGGIVSNVLTANQNQTIQAVIDVKEINKKSDYVKTMWELRIMYFEDEEGTTVINTNPFKIDGANEAGLYTVNFTATNSYFRIYLVVNGSDIGEQFADAQMKIGSLKIQSVD